MFFVDPIAGSDFEVWVLFFLGGDIAGGGVWLVGGPTMVELMDEFGFVEREFVGSAFIFEEGAIVGHVENCLEFESPGVAGGGGFVPEDVDVGIDVFGEVGIGFGAEDGCGLGIGVDEGKICRGEGEVAFGVIEV